MSSVMHTRVGIVARRVKPLVLLVLPALLLSACAPYRYADRGPGGDPYGADMRMAVRAPIATPNRPERHRRIAKVARKVKQAARPILRTDPVLTEVDKALTKPLPSPQAVAGSGARTITESSVTVSSAGPSSPSQSPAFPNATKSRLVEQGRDLFRAGHVLKARERFMAALVEVAPGRVPEVLPDLARTYDPYYLQQLAKADVKPNPAMALAIYHRASMTGKRMNDADIERLERERN